MEIDRLLPVYDVSEHHHTAISASPERVYAAIFELDVSRSRVIRTLLRLRGIPRGEPGLLGFLDFGFIVLAEHPPTELVMGLLGRFWTLRGDLQAIAPDEFATWERDGYAKVAWNFHVAEEAPGTTRLSTETRIQCFGAKARRRFRLYWRLVGPFSAWTRREMLRLVKLSCAE